MMNRQQTLQLLTKAKPELARRFGVTRLALFGSTVQYQGTDHSFPNIQLNPVHANKINHPAAYRWLSYRAIVQGKAFTRLRSDRLYTT